LRVSSRVGRVGAGVSVRELPNHGRVVRTLARWLFGEWGDLSRRPFHAYVRKVRESLRGDPLPFTVVAFAGRRPVGCASCWEQDMHIRLGLSPWLAAVYVDPAYRRRGIGSRLCREVEARARMLEYEKLHLFTPDREEFYQRMGWKTVERVVYRGQNVAIMEKKTAPAIQ